MGYDPRKVLCMQWDRRTRVDRGMQITMKLVESKDWLR